MQLKTPGMSHQVASLCNMSFLTEFQNFQDGKKFGSMSGERAVGMASCFFTV
jgi:hypothetical protein